MEKKRRKHDYVDNKKLYTEMLHYITELNEAKANNVPKEEWPRVSEYIGQCIYLISHNLAKKPNFANYSFKDEMIFDGIENCLMYLHNFNPDKYKNPFAYITTIIYYAFLRRIDKEKKQQYIKHKLMNHASVMNNLVDSQDDGDFFSTNLIQLDDDKAYALAERFEPKSLKPSMKKPKGVELFIDEDLDNDKTDTDSSTTDD